MLDRLVQTGEGVLRALGGDRLGVGEEGLVDAARVSHILSLRVGPVHLKNKSGLSIRTFVVMSKFGAGTYTFSDVIVAESVVLLDVALRLNPEVFYRLWRPPLCHVSVAVILAA